MGTRDPGQCCSVEGKSAYEGYSTTVYHKMGASHSSSPSRPRSLGLSQCKPLASHTQPAHPRSEKQSLAHSPRASRWAHSPRASR